MSSLVKTKRYEALTSYIPDGDNWRRCDRLWCFGITVTEIEDKLSMSIDWTVHAPSLPRSIRLGIPKTNGGIPIFIVEIPEAISIEVPGNVDGGLILDGKKI